MASSDVDQKFLGRLAKITAPSNALLSSSLYQLLGLSVLLSKRLFRARKLRKLDTTRDTKSLQLYHHILWLSREGLSILEAYVLPYTLDGQCGPECRVLGVKLRASFYHIFCLFHNNPPISQASVTSPSTPVPPLPLSPKPDNGQTRRGNNGNGKSTPKSTRKAPTLREPILSITSDATFITNPYAGAPFSTPTPTPALPPGLPIQPPHPAAFILPALNFIPITTSHFSTASTAATILPGSHPLRLSVALEHSAFTWDVLHDHAEARRISRNAIREVSRAQEGLADEEFEDVAELVGVLGRMMRRGSKEGTPRPGGVGSPPSASESASGGRSGEERGSGPGGIARRSQAEGRRKLSSSSERTAGMGDSPGSTGTTRRASASRREQGSGSGSSRSPGSAPRSGQRREQQRTSNGSQEATPRAGHRSQQSGASRNGVQGTPKSGGARSNGSNEATPRRHGARGSGGGGSSKDRTPPAIPDRTSSATPRAMHQMTPRGTQQSSPRTAQQSTPRTVQQSTPRTTQQSTPRTTQQSSPRSAQQTTPRSPQAYRTPRR